MADHSKPLTTSTYANFVSELDARFDDLAVGLDPAVTTATNLPTNAIRWSSAANKWQKWNGTTWNDLTSTYVYPSISVTGNATLGDASGDTITINASTVSIPNSLNFDSNTLFIDATNNRVGILDATPSYALDVAGTGYFGNGIILGGAATLGSVGSRQFSFEYPTTRFYVGDGTGYSFALTKRSASTNTDLFYVDDANGHVGIGTTSVTNVSLRVSPSVIGNVNSYSIYTDPTIAATVTTSATMFHSQPLTTASAFTLTNLYHYTAGAPTIGAGSTLTNQTGFYANIGTSATVNYGLLIPNIAAATGKSSYGIQSSINASTGTNYNLYVNGSADNYIQGDTSFGTAVPVDNSVTLYTTKNISWKWGNGYNYANIFNQEGSASTIIASGYQRSATSYGFASSVPVSWAKSAISVGSGEINFYTNDSTIVAVGTDVTPTKRMQINYLGGIGFGSRDPYTTAYNPSYGYLQTYGFALQCTAGFNVMNLTTNGFVDSSSQTVSYGIATGSQYTQANGRHVFSTFNATAADQVQTLTEVMKLDSDSSMTLISGGSAGSPVIRIANDTNTGIYSPGTDQIGFTTAGTAAMTLDSAGNARIYGTLGVKDAAPATTAAITSSITHTANAGTRFGINNTLATTNEVLTADRTTYGVYNANSSTYQNAAAFTLTQYGSYNQAYTNTNSGNTLDGEGSLIGSYNYALHQSDDATYKRIESGYGSYNLVYSSGDTSLIDVAIGSYNFVRTAGTSASASVAINTGYGNYTQISAGAANRNITTAYGYYLNATETGTITTKYGLYIAPAWSNYIAGGLQIGGTASSAGISGLGIGVSPSGTYSIETSAGASFGGNTQISVGYFRVVDGGSAASPSIQPGNDGDTGMFWPATNTIGFSCAGVEQFRADSTGQLWNTVQSQVGTDYTTLYKGYFCRAWVNFNGTGTVAIRASGNVSSITDNGAGDYTVNFTTAMPDANYGTNVTCESIANGTDFNLGALSSGTAQTTALVRVISAGVVSSLRDSARMCISVFR